MAGADVTAQYTYFLTALWPDLGSRQVVQERRSEATAQPILGARESLPHNFFADLYLLSALLVRPLFEPMQHEDLAISLRQLADRQPQTGALF